MKHLKIKNALAVVMLFSLAVSGGIATARFSGTTNIVSNSISLMNGQKKQKDAGILKEPEWDNGGKDLAAKGMMAGESVQKNPYIVSNADWTSWAFMKVDIPLFSDGTDSVSLLNLSDKWQLLKDEKNGNVHTKIYGYKTRLSGGNSGKAEADRARTDSLFDSFRANSTTADKPFIGSLNVYGTLVQSDDTDDLKKIAERAEFDDGSASESIFRISYDLDGGTLTGQKYLYTKDDYGYTPPTPVKDGFGFTGWSPASIPQGSTGDITFTSGWTPNILTINYHSSGANTWNDPSGQSTNLDASEDVIVHTDEIAYNEDYSPDSTHNALAGILDANRLKKTGYHTSSYWKTGAGKEVSDQTNMIGYKGSDTADYLGVLPEFKKKSTTVDIHTEWTANTYTIKYNANAPSGTTPLGSMVDTNCTYDESKTLSENTYSINNYSFLSWNTKADGSGTSYADGASVKNLTDENNDTVTLYAQWKLNIIYVDKPTVSGSYTYDKSSHACTVSGYNAAGMTQSGTTAATNAGTYTVKFALKDGYAWSDKTRDDLTLTWNIAKRKITIPSLSNTSQAFDGSNKNVTINGVDGSYVNQSGTATAKNTGTYTVTWSLKDTGNTTWSDNSTGNKSANWSINWVNGTSHYSNDIYNRGWFAPGWTLSNGNFTLYNDHIQMKEETTYDGTIILKSPNANTPLKKFLAEVSCSGKCNLYIRSGVKYRNYIETTSMSIPTSGTSNKLQTLYSNDVQMPSAGTTTSTYTNIHFSNSSGTHKEVNIYRIAWVN